MNSTKPKALILTYYWPPAGGSGVQRWLKFCKYLGDFGWDVVVYTARSPEAPAFDTSLCGDIPNGIEVIKRDAFEPYRLFRLLTGTKEGFGAGFASSSSNRRSWMYRLSFWLRSNLFIPDAKMLWVRPSIRFLCKYLRDNPVSVLISTGPPHSMHLIARGIKKRTGIKWIADFRDPWTNINYIQELSLSTVSYNIHRQLERKVIKGTDCVVVVSDNMRDEFEPLGPKRIEVITNGYDEADFMGVNPPLDEKFSITHVGTLPANSNCHALWQAISRFVGENNVFAQHLQLKFAGRVDASIMDTLREQNLAGYCQNLGYIPHDAGIMLMRSSHVLMLLVTDSPNSAGILTGKFFEYLGAKRPILVMGTPNGDLDTQLNRTSAGKLFPFNDAQAAYEGIRWYWEKYYVRKEPFTPTDTEGFSRRSLTERMANLMNDHISR